MFAQHLSHANLSHILTCLQFTSAKKLNKFVNSLLDFLVVVLLSISTRLTSSSADVCPALVTHSRLFTIHKCKKLDSK